jgi:S-adenosylmethionine hydrolase
MSTPLITLTTDFGEGSAYVAAMKGVILRINAAARVVDLGHAIPPQDIRHAAWFLACSVPWFPPETIHVIVVDPGVGTDRRLLLVRAGNQWMLAPDNGCYALAASKLGWPPREWSLTAPQYWLPQVSRTFHGRDILAPVAAHLSLGVLPKDLGHPIQDPVQISVPVAQLSPKRLRGEVIFVDHFGNLITDLTADHLKEKKFDAPRVLLKHHAVEQFVGTYGEAAEGSVVSLVGSEGHLEVAVVNGSAANKLGVGVGFPVEVRPGRRKRK